MISIYFNYNNLMLCYLCFQVFYLIIYGALACILASQLLHHSTEIDLCIQSTEFNLQMYGPVKKLITEFNSRNCIGFMKTLKKE